MLQVMVRKVFASL